jgi:hypothetical protein
MDLETTVMIVGLLITTILSVVMLTYTNIH